MEEVKNLTQDDVLEIIKDFPLKPKRNRLIITVNSEKVEEDEVDLGTNTFCESQYVIAVGDFIQNIEAGQKVLLDLKAMMSKEVMGQIEIDPIEVDGKMFAFIYDSVIKADDNR